MTPEVGVFAQVAVISVCLAGALSAIIVALVRGVSQPKRKPPSFGEGHNQQIEQLQQSVDAIAVEVERIAEAQRFSARLLAERAEPAALPRSESA
jgi:hypothetical protein